MLYVTWVRNNGDPKSIQSGLNNVLLLLTIFLTPRLLPLILVLYDSCPYHNSYRRLQVFIQFDVSRMNNGAYNNNCHEIFIVTWELGLMAADLSYS